MLGKLGVNDAWLFIFFFLQICSHINPWQSLRRVSVSAIETGAAADVFLHFPSIFLA